MDIYSFVPSRDIREYWKEIGFKPTATEAAFIIFHSNATIKEKHEGYRAIINEYEDTRVLPRTWTKSFKSLFGLLESLIAIEEDFLEIDGQEGYVYSYSYYCAGDDSECEEFDLQFSTLQACLGAYYDDIEDYADKVVYYKIRRQSLKDVFDEIVVKYAPGGEAISYFKRPINEEDILFALGGLWLPLPTPFKLGDIIAPCRGYDRVAGDPLVLASLPSWTSEDYVRAGYLPGEFDGDDVDRFYNFHLDSGDDTDMCVRGYFISESGSVYHECEGFYLDYEYYTSKREGYERMLTLMSKYLKRELEIDEVLRLSYIIQLEVETRTRRALRGADYSDIL